MKFFTERRFLTGTILAIAAVLFLVLNVMSGSLFKSVRLDLTEAKLYTLSSGSKEIINELQEPIILRFYFSQSLANINPYVTSFAERVKDLLYQYQRASHGKIVVAVIDPEPFSTAEDEAVNYGLQGAPVDTAGTEFYLGIVGTDALNAQQVIPFLQVTREPNLEYDISQLIYKLIHPQPRSVGVMSALPIEGEVGARPWAIWRQMQQLFALHIIETDTTLIPDDINTLMLVDPSSFSQDALAAIDKFIMRGGHILAFVDPVSEVTDPRTAAFNKTQPETNNYLKLLRSWGIDFDAKQTVADRELAKTVRVPYEGREVSLRYPLWMDLVDSNFSKDDVLSSALDRITMATPGFLTKNPQTKAIFTPLITTSAQAMAVDADRVADYQQNMQKFLNDYTAVGKYTLAARISGPIQSAYSDSSVPDSNIVVVADTDMLHDHFWISVQNLMGQEFAMPSASNGNFVLSALDNLSGSNALISIRNKGSFSRPFETVRSLELKSQAKYLESEQELQQKLEQAKQKLEQFASQKQDGNAMSLTVQQKKAEETFRQELIATRKELRDVRRKLHHDIEAVATTIKFFTVGLLPLLIVAGGLSIWILQQRQHRKSGRQNA